LFHRALVVELQSPPPPPPHDELLLQLLALLHELRLLHELHEPVFVSDDLHESGVCVDVTRI
jgi:hypothetical protein